MLAEVSDEEVLVDEQARRLTAAAGQGDGAGDLRRVLEMLGDRRIGVVDVGLRRPTLDDVFLTLTGHSAEHVVEEGESPGGGTDDGGAS